VSKESHPGLFARVTLDWAHGRCAWFALALNHRFGWAIEGFADISGRVVHVANVVSGELFDGYGFGEPKDVVSSFVALGSPGIHHVGRLTPLQVRVAFSIESCVEDPEFDAAVEACTELARGLNIPLEKLTVAVVTDSDDTFRAARLNGPPSSGSSCTAGSSGVAQHVTALAITTTTEARRAGRAKDPAKSGIAGPRASR